MTATPLAPSRRALRSVAMAAVVLLALTGCVKIHSTTAISSDELITQDLILAVNPALLSQFDIDASEFTAAALGERVPESASDRVTIEDYHDGDLNGVIVHA